jgi:predicted Zn-dependent protease
LAALGLTLAILSLGGVWALRFFRSQRLSADAVWAQAQEHLKAKRFDRVDQAVVRLRRLRQPTPLDWFLRAQLAVARDRPDQAIDYLSRVPDDHYMAAQARMLAGQIELRRHRLRLGEQALHAAIVLDPALVQAHRELIFIYGLQLRRSELNTEFVALSSLSELTFKEARDWCMLHVESWDPSEAARLLAECVAADPRDRWSRIALAENYRRMGLLNEAESALQGLAKSDPDALAAHARIAFDRQELDRAEQLLRAGPADNPVLARLRGRLALSRQDSREALHQFQIAYAADPDAGETLSGLIATLKICGDEKAAAPLRAIAAKREKLSVLIQRATTDEAQTDPLLRRQLGAACADLNRDAEARAWYQLAIARDPLDSDAQQALFRLRGAYRAEPAPIRGVP